MNMDYMVKIVFLLPVVGAMVIFLFSCEELTQSGEDENNSNT